MVEVNKFNKILLGSVITTIIVSLVGIVAISFISPHVRGVTVQKLAIDFYFSHPMDRKTVESAVSVSPEVKFTLSWGLNNLQLNFTDNLDLDTEYKVQIADSAKDIYGKAFATKFEYSFHTQSPQFTYLERNGLKQLPDKIISYDLKTNFATELYSATGIDYFARNSKYLVISEIDTAKISTVRLINLDSKETKSISLGKPFRLTRLVFSPRNDQFAFVSQEVENRNGVGVPQGSSYIYLYDIPSGQIKKYSPPNVLDILFSPDGGSLLFRGDEAIYYLIDLQTEELIDLDRHFASGGFSREVNRIVFVDYDPIASNIQYPNINIYNTDREVISITNGEQFVVDPEFFHRQEQIAYSQKYQELDGTKGIFSIIVSDLAQNKLLEIKKEGVSLELPKLSSDDRYILIENYLPSELTDYTNMRNYVFQTKPYSGGLLIYDTKTKDFLPIDLRGVDAVWN